MSATLLFFAAIARMPIADALALLMSYPLIVTALSPILLGERVHRIQWIAVLVGLSGVLFILRPGSGAFQWAGGLALLAGISFALYMVTTRKVAGSSPPLVTLVYSAVVGALLLSVAAPFFWVMPQRSDWALMAAIGLLAASGHFLIVKAFELAPASRIAPFGYVEIVAATVLGYAMFGDFPDAWAFLGMAVIIAGGVLISYPFRREPI